MRFLIALCAGIGATVLADMAFGLLPVGGLVMTVLYYACAYGAGFLTFIYTLGKVE